MTKRMLKTADPTMVPVPTSPFAIKTPANKKRQKRKSMSVRKHEVLS
jgi:hypothetical protein